MIQLKDTTIKGCYEITPRIQQDQRGFFVKTFHKDIFASQKLVTEFTEEYYSVSHKGVLRGLHFQTPPADHIKMVYCVLGEVMDVVVDLRIGSPTYGQYASFELTAKKANMIYIPKGLAHGFYVTSEQAILMYKVTTVYSPEHDTGIRWNSVGIPWPDTAPIISRRDNSFGEFADFISPFRYGGI